jgi:hypothetical protein
MAPTPLQMLKRLWDSQVMDEEQRMFNYVCTPSYHSTSSFFMFFSGAIAMVLEIASLGAFYLLRLHVGDLSLSQSDYIAEV